MQNAERRREKGERKIMLAGRSQTLKPCPFPQPSARQAGLKP